MEKYTIIIKNNESGEILFEREANALIAGVAGGELPSAILLKGTEEEMLVAMNIVQNEMNKVYESDEEQK